MGAFRFNMRRSTAVFSVVCALLSGFLATGCNGFQFGDVTANTLVGQWSAADRPFHWQFSADGRCQLSTIGTPQSGNYEVNDSTLIVHLDDGTNLKTRLEMQGDQLKASDADGSFMVFSRVP